MSTSSFYARRRRPPSARAKANAALLVEIREIHEQSRKTYGAPRVRGQLRHRGHRVSRHRVARLVRREGLVGVHGRKTWHKDGTRRWCRRRGTTVNVAWINSGARLWTVPDPPERQHVVSQVLSALWTVDGGFWAMDTASGRTWVSSPRAFGWVRNFIAIDADDAERRWGSTEGAANAALDAVADRTIFDHPEHVATLKQLFALHFARSHVAAQLWDNTTAKTIEDARTIEDYEPGALARAFGQEYGRPPINDEDLLVAANLIADHVAEHLRTGEPFREQILHLVERSIDEIADARIQVGIVEEGPAELVLADSPTVPLDTKAGRIGILEGVGIRSADTFFMPLGPKTVMSLVEGPDAQNSWIDLDANATLQLNLVQHHAARRQVIGRSEALLRVVHTAATGASRRT